MACIDYEQAFDLVRTSAVMQALIGEGVDEPYIKVMEDIYVCGLYSPR